MISVIIIIFIVVFPFLFFLFFLFLCVDSAHLFPLNILFLMVFHYLWSWKSTSNSKQMHTHLYIQFTPSQIIVTCLVLHVLMTYKIFFHVYFKIYSKCLVLSPISVQCKPFFLYVLYVYCWEKCYDWCAEYSKDYVFRLPSTRDLRTRPWTWKTNVLSAQFSSAGSEHTANTDRPVLVSSFSTSHTCVVTK